MLIARAVNKQVHDSVEVHIHVQYTSKLSYSCPHGMAVNKNRTCTHHTEHYVNVS